VLTAAGTCESALTIYAGGYRMERLVRDGVALAYEEQGAGDPPLVLVHGWCCDHTYFAPQAAYFAGRHRVVAIDLRGHGASDKPEQDYTLDVFADDLAWLCERLGVTRPVVIGHSLGGAVALAVAVRFPSLPVAIGALDSPLARAPEAVAAVERLVARLWGPDYRPVARQFCDENLFVSTDDPARRARILDGMSAAPQHVMASAMEGLARYDSAAALSALTVPMLFIAANEAKPRADVARLRALCSTLILGQTVGSGHFLQLEVPDQVNAMLDRFLTLVAGAPSSAS
jgi:pimeloyl-ACP methyl ester carboxylesterase